MTPTINLRGGSQDSQIELTNLNKIIENEIIEKEEQKVIQIS